MAELDDAAARILALGGEGKGRAEIAVALGVSVERLQEMERDQAEIHAALQLAATAARAWWEAIQREALSQGARVNAGAWRAAMAWRFGELGEGGAAPEPPRETAIYDIPHNGRPRRKGFR